MDSQEPKFCTLTAAVMPTKRSDKFLGFIPLPRLIVADKASTLEIKEWGAARVFEELTGEKPYGDILITKPLNIIQGSISPDVKEKK